jgi:hypothetical protein
MLVRWDAPIVRAYHLKESFQRFAHPSPRASPQVDEVGDVLAFGTLQDIAAALQWRRGRDE